MLMCCIFLQQNKSGQRNASPKLYDTIIQKSNQFSKEIIQSEPLGVIVAHFYTLLNNLNLHFFKKFLVLLCRLPDRLFIASEGSKGGKLSRTVPHRHLRMALRHMMWQVDDIVVITHNS